MSETTTRQIIQAFKANFKNESVTIPGALRQEQPNIVFTALVDPNEQQMMSGAAALSPLSTADLFAMPGGEPSAPQSQLPLGTMENQGMPPQPQPTGPQPSQPMPGQQPPSGPQPQPQAQAPQAPPQAAPRPQDLSQHLLMG